MNNKKLLNAIGNISEDYINEAVNFSVKKKKIRPWFKWSSAAACFAIMLVAVANFVPMMLGGDIENTTTGTETKLEKYYDYGINSGEFAAYIGGYVVSEDKIGNKIENVVVTGGWKNEASEWISTETLNAEVYEITGIDSGVAVALKFIDQGEAVTTTHYYVIMNPNADLSAVEDYIIAPIVPNNPGDEMVNE